MLTVGRVSVDLQKGRIPRNPHVSAHMDHTVANLNKFITMLQSLALILFYEAVKFRFVFFHP